MEHLLGCHAEWLYAAQAAATLPFVGAWFKLAVLPHFHRHNPPAVGNKEA